MEAMKKLIPPTMGYDKFVPGGYAGFGGCNPVSKRDIEFVGHMFTSYVWSFDSQPAPSVGV